MTLSRTLSIVILMLLCLTFAAQAQNSPKREFRGYWLSTVTNIDWPPSPGTPAPAAQAALVNILDRLAAQGFNAVVFQVRPECDALYASSLEPWSYVLTGSQGSSPGYDPLDFAVQEAHKRGMELHAWFNPYRAVRDTTYYTVSPNHVSVTHPQWILVSGKLKMLNPGMAVVRDYVLRVITDVVRRYDVDGIHMDDYFYTDNYSFAQDAATFAAEPRGFTDQGDWRRDNVNTLIRAINDSVHAIKAWVKFGMSPRGIWRNNVPPGIVGNDNYSSIYCDSRAWLVGQYIDYLAPQLYWRFGGGQDYGLLEPWWGGQRNGRHLYPGLATYRIGQTAFGGAGEIARQIRFYRDQQNAEGAIQFTANYLMSNTGGIADTLSRDLFRFPALLPRMTWKDTVAPYPVRGIAYANSSGSAGFALQWQAPIVPAGQDTAVRYAVYRFDHYPQQSGDFTDNKNLLGISGARLYAPAIPPVPGAYYYAVTALDRNWNEGDTSNIVRITPPAAVILAAPASGSGVPDSVRLVWRLAPAAGRYWLQVGADSGFAGSLLVNDSTLADTTATARNLLGTTTYYWRVRAGNGGGWGVHSAVRSVGTRFPGPIGLLYPANGQSNIPAAGEVRWHPAPANATYRFQLGLSQDFAKMLIDTTGVKDTVLQYAGLSSYTIYFWRVQGTNAFGLGNWSPVFRFRTLTFDDVPERQGVPDTYQLEQNYPNPFNPTTTISFAIPAAGHVRLVIYDMLGREVARLVDASLPAGYHHAAWNGAGLSSGVYIYRLEAGSFTAVKRMVLVK